MNGTITIKAARMFADLTEKEVCSALKIRPAQLRAWEAGKTLPTVDHAIELIKLYNLPIDVINFNKASNQAEQKSAKLLTVEDVALLPEKSVVWLVTYFNDEDGIVSNSIIPLIIIISGPGGVLYAETGDSYVRLPIDSETLNDPNYSIWDSLPDRSLLQGISEREYNKTATIEKIVFPALATAITRRGVTFNKLCELTGIKNKRLNDQLTGKGDLMQWEIKAIVTALHLSDDETRQAFFPEFAGYDYDDCGKRIEPVPIAQI